MTKDYYKILGIAEFETAENIKKAYKKLVRKYHPDIAGNSSDVISRFKEITEAYEVLSNKTKKEEYDRARRFYSYARENHFYRENPDTKTTNPQNKEKKFSFNWEEFLSKKQRENSFRKEEIKAPKRGQDINSEIEISIFEAMSGCTKIINMLQTKTCPKCNGRKFINNTECPHCKGKGEFSEYKKFNVKIPANIKNKSKIRLCGEGERGINGGTNGDLYLTINIIEPLNYKTEGLNILKTVPITPYEAVLGGNIEISTLKEKIKIKIAPNTQIGRAHV